jgi:altronate dehydratase
LLRDPIGLCHKFALHAIARGALVHKYGEAIGHATCDIQAGEHVHTHNLKSNRAA